MYLSNVFLQTKIPVSYKLFQSRKISKISILPVDFFSISIFDIFSTWQQPNLCCPFKATFEKEVRHKFSYLCFLKLFKSYSCYKLLQLALQGLNLLDVLEAYKLQQSTEKMT